MKTSFNPFYFVILFILSTSNLKAQSITTINSLSELKEHLGDNDGNFKMTSGTYYFNSSNCGEGKLFDDPVLLLFTGNNSTFDFTDVKFEYDTEIFTLFGNIDIIEFWPVGSNNIYLNLTMEDIGFTIPSKGASSVHLDGSDNRIEGFKTTTRGSFPYGYGDIFGKGGGSVINHNKHAGILIRGDRNHIKNCSVIMRAYGHGIFVQGSHDATIEGCYVEGELRKVSDVLAEEGTKSPADNVDFETVWGFNLRDLEHDYTFSLQEAGIRAYSTGVVYDNEGNATDETSRQTLNTTVKDCKIVKMRVGVNTGAEGGDNKLIENCTALACEVGFWLGNDGSVVDCKGDASVGPLFSEDIGRSNASYELTLLDNYVPRIGYEPYIFIAGNSHNFTLHDGTTQYDSDIKIQIGGTRQDHRWLTGSDSEPMTRSAESLTFTNNTKYPVTLESNASDNTIYTCGNVTNNGSNNTISELSNCTYSRTCSNTPDNLQAECYDDMLGIESTFLNDNNDQAITKAENGDWISFNNIDLTGVISIKAIVASTNDTSNIEVRQGNINGTLLATLPIPNTGSIDNFQTTASVNLTQNINTLVDVYFVFTGQNDSLFNLDQLSFEYDTCHLSSYNPHLPISASDFCDSSGVSISNLSDYNIVTDIDNGDYIKFGNVDFGYDDVYNEIEVLASSTASNGATIEVRSGSIDGDLLASIQIENTESNSTYKESSSFTSTNITGMHDLYFVFKGTEASLLNLASFYFNHDECSGKTYDAYSEIDALDYCEMYGVVPIDNDYLGGIHDGDWIRYGSVDFTSTSPGAITMNLSGLDETEGIVYVKLNDPQEGSIIATVEVPKTSGWTNWEEVTVQLNQEITGTQEVYVYFTNSAYNIDWFKFHAYIPEPENLALTTNGGIASQSTTAYDGEASRANDGNTDGNYGSGSVSHTEHGTEGSLKWWQVELESESMINEIVLYNRTGSNYSEFLNNFTVEIINEDDSTSFSQFFENYPNPSLSINTGGAIGKYVKISKTSDRGITLAEVEVYGSSTLSSENIVLKELKFFPNPATHQITITNAVNTSLEIYNINGVLEFKTTITKEIENIAIDKLHTGIHLLKFRKNNLFKLEKLIKQ